jgi:hypothetical protein
MGPELASVRRAFAEFERALRPDSGTRRADSTFLRELTRVSGAVDAAAKRFDSPALQILLYPGGAVYQAEARRGTLRPRESEGEVARLLRLALDSIGVHAYPAEGDVYFMTSEGALRRVSAAFVTSEMRELLRLESEQQWKPTAGDASIGIPFDSLGSRSVAWYRLSSIPAFAGRGRARDQYCWHLRLLLRGTDNTAIFDRRTLVLDSATRAVFERFARLHAHIRPGQLVARYLEVLVANGYRRTPAVEAYLDSIANQDYGYRALPPGAGCG